MNKKITFSTVFAFILSAPLALAATHTVRGDLTAFFEAFRCIFHLNTACFANNLISAAPLFGLILIVYGLTYFIAVTTIFSGDGHAKYARMMALGIAILGIAQQKVYGFILGLSSTFLIATFFIAIIFMVIIFFNKTKTNHHNTAAEMKTAHVADLTAKKDLLGVKHDVGLDKKYYKRINNDLDKLNSDLNNMSKLVGSEKHQLDEIHRLMGLLVTSKKHNEEGLVHQYTNALASKLGNLIASFKEDDVINHHLNSEIEHVDAILSHWNQTEKAEQNTDHLLDHILKKLSIVTNNSHLSELRTNHEISNILHQIHHELNNLKSIRKYLDDQVSILDDFSYPNKHLHASDLRSSIFDSNLKTATEHFQKLSHVINNEPLAIEKLKSGAAKARSHIGNINGYEERLTYLIKRLVKKLEEDAQNNT